jgi:PII-like signaling protein
VIADALKLSVYFGDGIMAGTELASDALMRSFSSHEVRVAALLRGAEGFGLGRRIHAERFPDLSTDLPLLAMAVDQRERIEGLLDDVDAIVSRGLVTLEPARLVTGKDLATATFPEGVSRAGKLTIYCGRGERSNGRPAFREAVDVLRRHGASGAIVLMGVDGVLGGRRRQARLFAANVDTPMVIISVGSVEILGKALPALQASLQNPLVTVERIAQLKHDGELLGPLPEWDDHGGDAAGVWHTLRIYARRSAQVNGRPLYSELTHRLREVGAAGVTTILGEWGFSSDERPYGDRLGRFASHTPSYTAYIDRPQKVAEVWPIVDEITAAHGIVTWLVVPGYRERAGEVRYGALGLPEGSPADQIAAFPALSSAPLPPRDAADEDAGWVRELAAQVHSFARERGLHDPLVRVTLVDGERFFLASLAPQPGGGFVTLTPHPEHYGEMVAGHAGEVLPPRVLIVPRESITKVEVLAKTPRGTRSLVRFRPPE